MEDVNASTHNEEGICNKRHVTLALAMDAEVSCVSVSQSIEIQSQWNGKWFMGLLEPATGGRSQTKWASLTHAVIASAVPVQIENQMFQNINIKHIKIPKPLLKNISNMKLN